MPTDLAEQSAPHVPTNCVRPRSAGPSSRRRTRGGVGLVLACLGAIFLGMLGVPDPARAVCPKSQVLESMLTNICWGCVFPFRLGGQTLIQHGFDVDPAAPTSMFCQCDDSAFPGVTVGFSEPIRLIEVVREPYCFPSLEGAEIKENSYERYGTYQETNNADTNGEAFYHVHYIGAPLWQILGLSVAFIGSSISDMSVGFFPDLSKCFSTGGYDVSNYTLLYLSELDPTWSDDELASLLNPEAILFGNPVSQALCAADCMAATAGVPLDALFWCAGCQGSMYPYTGTVSGPAGELNTATLLAERMLAKLNREFFEALTSTDLALCGKVYTSMIRKSQYRLQLLYPIPNTQAPLCCPSLGSNTLLWGAGKSYPVYGEDFSFLVWRQRDCCAR
jgi:conjugal transfer pilus assembly protein TraU